ncbi:hypothetical protein Bcep22_gp39 [Burkholderia phage Bcep22]|uniref:Uncharacterized protein n=2 Tax=Lessievirus TaxID=1720323 RepID=Q6V7Q4_9CAUD|nr:hypothetical protein Bcep22_gp39 [Burkholderia phage Bcep22]YP_007236780.1 hypothetical protein G167_gp51 [Burkholderia phage BcepMigl]AAQ54972.1 hypothetical protein Bcep22_gp39 [Burkholderia phage Bcep22]AFN39103.1 hypothetical protein BcepMigl_gp34 [Burkholderia phage BcepMigl]
MTTTQKKSGTPAFPSEGITTGMWLRDYFAAKALVGYLASVASDFEPAEHASSIAEDCYALADAMLRAREA